MFKSNLYLRFKQNQVQDVRKYNGFEDQSSLDSVIDSFQDWINKQPHFVTKQYDRNYLEMLLMSAKGSLEKAKRRFDMRCTYCTLMPELYDVDPDNLERTIPRVSKAHKHIIMPTTTEDNYRVFLDKFIDADKFNVTDFIRFMAVNFTEYLLHNDYNVGYIGIVDLRHIKLGTLLTKLNPMVLQKMSMVGMDSYGTRFKAIHFLHDSKLIETVVSLLKQAINPKVAGRILLHRDVKDLQQHVAKECLPYDYGGLDKTSDELYELQKKEILSKKHLECLKNIRNYKTDESKRTKNEFNNEYLGTVGSFRTLSID